MSVPDLRGNRLPLRVPTPPRGEPIARYATYLEAQRAVDHLSDHEFPVQFVTIVGSGLRMVERVIGRRTYPRAALGGAATGAWFGLMVGTLYLLFGSPNNGAQLGTSVVLGAVFGMLFGVASYGLSGGRRDFTSTSQIVASEYEVLCMPEYADRARDLLHQLSWGAGRPAEVPPVPPGPPAPGSASENPEPGPAPGPAGRPTGAGDSSDQTLGVSGPTYSEMIARQRQARAEEEARARQADTSQQPGSGDEPPQG